VDSTKPAQSQSRGQAKKSNQKKRKLRDPGRDNRVVSPPESSEKADASKGKISKTSPPIPSLDREPPALGPYLKKLGFLCYLAHSETGSTVTRAPRGRKVITSPSALSEKDKTKRPSMRHSRQNEESPQPKSIFQHRNPSQKALRSFGTNPF